jgi:hypothetical protein
MKQAFDCLQGPAPPHSGAFLDPFVDSRRLPCPPFQPTPFDKLKGLCR